MAMERPSTEQVKKWLFKYKYEERDIDMQLERLDALESRITSLGSPAISDMPKSPSPAQDRVADMICMKIDLADEIKIAIENHRNRRKHIEKAIAELEKPEEKAVLRARYLDLMDWKSVAGVLFGDRYDFVDREDSYLRRMYKIHSSALVNLSGTVAEIHDRQVKQ